MKAAVVIEKTKQGQFRAAAQGQHLGGYIGANAGDTPEAAAGFAAREIIRYSSGNPEGGAIFAPREVLDLIPPHLHSIPHRRTR